MEKRTEVTLKTGQKAWLITDDTFTLAWANMAESTPKELAERIVRGSLAKLTHDRDQNIASKAAKALEQSDIIRRTLPERSDIAGKEHMYKTARIRESGRCVALSEYDARSGSFRVDGGREWYNWRELERFVL